MQTFFTLYSIDIRCFSNNNSEFFKQFRRKIVSIFHGTAKDVDIQEKKDIQEKNDRGGEMTMKAIVAAIVAAIFLGLLVSVVLIIGM